MTSQRRRSRLGTSCGVSATCYVGQDHLGAIHLRRPLELIMSESNTHLQSYPCD